MFSKTEIRDLLKAWIAISIAFGIVLRSETPNIIFAFILSAVTVGIGFLLHELAHKFVAQKYKYKAEFRSFDSMLILAIALSFLGFVIAAPGAVMLQGIYNKTKNGKISLAGPLTNIILAIIFFLLTPILGQISHFGFLINAWLALFNMLPFPNFDGAKVLAWNKLIYTIILLVSIVLLLLTSL